ncbi:MULTISPECIES: cytochrome c oxidase subunit II [unclassified Brachybacterium]|uniref:aa3-type cytochrome oxidase subunit II n=1 Tax=unclassified Brachybacterium TaxID=2623841 RepID=UPI000C80F5F5|nr:cytochrome c oxidase subunit II [Brachybacterium sp. UMB0905]PMC75745.1 cytochrome c oxidase subunit II [Brachybacterium sp. UMB0905]
MIPQVPQRVRHGRRLAAAGLALAVMVLAGCTLPQQRGFMPHQTDGQEVTNHTERITNLWVGSWVILVVVGLIVWGLTIWCAIAYRRHKNDTGFPIQLRYHVPLELMFTLVPVVMVLTFFYFTQRDAREIEMHVAEPDVTVNVVGKQWSWDINYVDEDVHEDAGVQSFRTGEPGAAESLPVIYLPVDQTVEFRLDSRDVIHSFWVVDFLYKKDMFPGHTTSFQVTPTRIGEYEGKCAELCGEYHSDMLFIVKVVSQEEYDQHIQELRERGNEGQLGVDLSRNEREWEMREKHDEVGPRYTEPAANEGE